MSLEYIMSLIDLYQNQLTIITSLISAVATVMATRAAFSSAKSASDSFRASAGSEKRMNIRNLLLDAHSVEIELERIEQLGSNLKLSYQSLAAFNNVLGSPREGVHQNDVIEKIDHARSTSKASKELTSNPKALQNWDDESIAEKHIEISTALLKLNALKDIMSMELSRVIIQLNEAKNAKLK